MNDAGESNNALLAGKGAVRPANAAEGPGELLEQLPLESVMVVTSPHQVAHL